MQYVREYFYYFRTDPSIYWMTTISVCVLGYVILGFFLLWLDGRR